MSAARVEFGQNDWKIIAYRGGDVWLTRGDGKSYDIVAMMHPTEAEVIATYLLRAAEFAAPEKPEEART